MRRQSTFQEDPGEIVIRVREWVEVVTGRDLSGDLRESLQDGIVLCEFMAKVRPGSIQRVNKLRSPIAHLDNIRSFLQACRTHFLLKDAQTFDVTDLQDPEQRSGAFTSAGIKGWDAEKRLKSVCVTLFWIGRKLGEEREYQGPLPDLSVFHPVLPAQVKSVPILEEPDEVLVSPPQRARQPPSVPSRPEQNTLAKLFQEPSTAISTDAGAEAVEERLEMTIVPANGSFGFHLLSKPIEGTNKFLSTVHSVLEDSSAGRAGLRRGDELLRVNGMDTAYFSHQQIVKLIKDSVVAQSLTVMLRRKDRLPSETTDTAPAKKEEPRAPSPPEEVAPPPDAPKEAPNEVAEVPTPRTESTGSAPNPAHYVFDSNEPLRSKYRAVPPPQDEAIYVNQSVLCREGPAGKETADLPKPAKTHKDKSPRNRKRSQERIQPEGSSDQKDPHLGAKTPRSQMPLPPTPQKETPQAPNSEPTRRKFFGSKKSGDQSPPKHASWKTGWKEAIVQSVEISPPPARLESVRLDPSEDSGEDTLRGKQERALNRVSMSDPFKGIVSVSDGRSLLDEIFPEGEGTQLASLLKEDSPLKTPPQTHKPNREYFAKILNPQISQQEPQPAPAPAPQEARLRAEREPDRTRHSPARSSASSERHSAKLVGSLLASSGPKVTPVTNDRRKDKRDTQEPHKQQAASLPRRQEPLQSAVPAEEPNIATQSLPPSQRPPPGPLPVPSSSSVGSSPSRYYANTQFDKPPKQQIPNGTQGRDTHKGYIGRAKSFTTGHPSRDSSDERNFSQLMARGYPGSEYTQGQEPNWNQKGQNLMRGQSLRYDNSQFQSPGRSLLQQYPRQDQRTGPYRPQGSYPQMQRYAQGQGGYFPQQGAYPIGQQSHARPPIPTEPQVPADGQYASKVFQIYANNASIPCTACKIPLGVGPATGLHGLHNIYHPPCFLCEVCGSQLFESTFIARGKLHCRCCEDSKEGSLSTEC